MASSYSFSIQIKAIILAVTVCISLYILDNCGGRDPYFRKIEDYLQFITLLYVFTIALLYKDMRLSLKQLAISLISVSTLVYIIKYLVNAKRPNGIGGYSFPSGHTSFAFVVATMIHKRYHLYYAIPAYINGTLVGYLRLFHHKHHLQDVICGAIIAIALTWRIVSRKES
ncbi:MAG: phosphatase PAP2 family protein [Proteobacteria bacterium]|nr:phosphatase PAP2 family protein [Pseudomonadota bacterium]